MKCFIQRFALHSRVTSGLFKYKNLHLYFHHQHPSSTLYSTMSINCEKKFEEKCIIGTHDGVFHCDEALACYMLKLLYPNSTIIRSRDQKVLDTCDIVVDVGGEYAPERYRFDHHQRSFEHTMKTLSSEIVSNIRLSSAGLVYHHFGKAIVKKIMQSENTDEVNYVYKRVYMGFIQEIDGLDNGVPQFAGEPLYDINTHVSNKIHHLNRPWNTNPEDYNATEYFEKAMKLVGGEFTLSIYKVQSILYPARKLVMEAIENRHNVHPSGDIIEFKKFIPWKDHFFEIENELNLKPTIKYVLFESEEGNFRVNGVSVTAKSFRGRKFLPPSWRGLRDDELSKKTGIDGCIFVHASGFIGGNKTRDGALQMAVKALESTEEEP